MKILIHADNPEPLKEQLQSLVPGHTVTTCDSYDGLPDRIMDFGPDAVFTIRFAGTPNFPSQSLIGEGGPSWIHVGGSGTDHLGTWDPSRTTVTNSAGVAAPVMAEYAMGAFLHFSLDVPGLVKDQRAQVWGARRVASLKEKCVVVIGLGNTGQAVAKLAKAFGMRVLGTRANPKDTENVDEVYSSDALDKLLPSADYVVISVPLTDETRGLLGKREFSLMKEGAVLVDLSRGGIVREAALITALEQKKLRGAALDVFETEPLPVNHPLWSMENVLISPHCSSVFEGWENASMKLFCENLERWTKGQALTHLVSPG